MNTVVVTGSRSWTNRHRIMDAFNWLANEHFKVPHHEITVVNGTASGADTLCRDVALDLGMQVVDEPAEWAKYGRSAGLKRNVLMLEKYKPDIVIAFWDSESRGTKYTIDQAKQRGIYTIVVRY